MCQVDACILNMKRAFYFPLIGLLIWTLEFDPQLLQSSDPKIPNPKLSLKLSHVGALYECVCKRVTVAFSVKVLCKSRKVLKKLEKKLD